MLVDLMCCVVGILVAYVGIRGENNYINMMVFFSGMFLYSINIMIIHYKLFKIKESK